MGLDSKKKLAVTGVASILLVAMVVAVAIGVNNKGGGDSGSEPTPSTGRSVNANTKAVESICSPTDYRETCEKSLAGANSTCTKTLLQMRGLKRLFMYVMRFLITPLMIWLSGAIANKEACIDAVENTTGETGDKMKQLLNTTSEMMSNGLAIITDFSSIFSSLQIGSFASRKLMEDEVAERDRAMAFDDFAGRRLLSVNINTLKPNVTVAQDGSGQFKTIGAAIGTLPKKSNATFIIHVKAGTYQETLVIKRKVNNVIIYGDGPTKTKVVNNKNYADGTATFHTAVLAVNGEGFMAKDITFENTAGASKHQAVAVRVSGDKAIFYNVVMNGYQDTLYAHNYRQLYRNCTISGTIDFIFGDGTAVFQKCKFIVRKPELNQNCMVTAQGRKDPRSQGITVIQDSEIVPEPGFTAVTPKIDAFLGRPWKEYSRTIIMHTFIDGFIDPAGWSPWMGTYALDTLYYGEYQNTGPGSDTSKRVTWKGIRKITPEIAQTFTAPKVYLTDDWVKNSSVPYTSGLV